MRYWPNPAHKEETTEAGPPRWRPHKSKCPLMSIEERETLMAESVPEDAARPESPRYAFRDTAHGLEWFAGRFTRMVDGEAEYHGYPTNHVPIRVLKRLRDDGRLSDAQYRRLRRELP